MDAGDTVDAVKDQVQARTAIAVDDQWLTFRGRLLEGNCTMADYNITTSSTLHLHRRLRGGMPSMANLVLQVKIKEKEGELEELRQQLQMEELRQQKKDEMQQQQQQQQQQQAAAQRYASPPPAVQRYAPPAALDPPQLFLPSIRNTTEENLRRVFSRYGQVASVDLRPTTALISFVKWTDLEFKENVEKAGGLGYNLFYNFHRPALFWTLRVQGRFYVQSGGSSSSSSSSSNWDCKCGVTGNYDSRTQCRKCFQSRVAVAPNSAYDTPPEYKSD